MKTFSQFSRDDETSDYEWCTFEEDDCCVHVLVSKRDIELQEARHIGVPLGGQYSATLHGAHTTPGMKHIHVYAGNKQLFALNKDSSAHDRSHGTRIPNKVAKALSQRFPDFKLPLNNIIESAPDWVMKTFGSELLLG